jgi:hypothetical protein
MLDELAKYKEKGHFFYQPNEALAIACNSPTDISGVLRGLCIEKRKN